MNKIARLFNLNIKSMPLPEWKRRHPKARILTACDPASPGAWVVALRCPDCGEIYLVEAGKEPSMDLEYSIIIHKREKNPKHDPGNSYNHEPPYIERKVLETALTEAEFKALRNAAIKEF